MSHALFAPSGSARWLICAGSMAHPANHVDKETDWTAEGTAAHILANRALDYRKRDLKFYHGEQIQVGTRVFAVDEEMEVNVQVYTDYVYDLAGDDVLMVEQHVDLSGVIGLAEQGGTADAIVIKGTTIHVVDLKYGKGERVSVIENTQLGLYALGAMEKYALLGPFTNVVLHIIQPRMDNLEAWPAPLDWLNQLAQDAKDAAVRAGLAMVASKADWPKFLVSTPKACRWCEAQADCPALTKRVHDEVGVDFEAMPASDEPKFEAMSNEELMVKYDAIGFITGWTKAIIRELAHRIGAGNPPTGNDGQPMKFVEGQTRRKWQSDAAACATLLQHFTPDIAIKTVPMTPAAAQTALNKKLGGKKKAEPTWNDTFNPLVVKPPGKPKVALGSDKRPAYTPAAGSDEFDDIGGDDDE